MKLSPVAIFFTLGIKFLPIPTTPPCVRSFIIPIGIVAILVGIPPYLASLLGSPLLKYGLLVGVPNEFLNPCENDFVDFAKGLLEKANGKIVLPCDTVVAPEFPADGQKVPHEVVPSSQIPADQMGLDVGPATIELFKKELEGAKTVVWNGPAGVFEVEDFAKGTNAICQAISELEEATTIIGGGDSASAAIKLGYEQKFSHISTGGGASLEYLEGKELPGVACIDDK